MTYVCICNIHARIKPLRCSVCYYHAKILLQGTKGYCCVTTTTIDQLIPKWLQGCHKVVATLLPGGKRGFKQPCCKAWPLQCYNNQILSGLLQGCQKLVARWKTSQFHGSDNLYKVVRGLTQCCHNQKFLSHNQRTTTLFFPMG